MKKQVKSSCHMAAGVCILFLGILMLLPQMSQAKIQKFTVEPGKKNVVKFTSKATLETVEGITDQISGYVSFDPKNLSAGVESEFVVDLASLDTNNKTRNKHMRENHLHTDQYPTCSFRFKEMPQPGLASLRDGESVTFKIRGDFSLHGVTRTIDPEITAIWNASSNTLNCKAAFDVLLSDYEIPLPQFLIMKLSDKQNIEVRFTAEIK